MANTTQRSAQSECRHLIGSPLVIDSAHSDDKGERNGESGCAVGTCAAKAPLRRSTSVAAATKTTNDMHATASTSTMQNTSGTLERGEYNVPEAHSAHRHDRTLSHTCMCIPITTHSSAHEHNKKLQQGGTWGRGRWLALHLHATAAGTHNTHFCCTLDDAVGAWR